MEVEISDMCLRLNSKNHTAEVKKSPKLSGDVIIPQSVCYEGENYMIKSLGYETFRDNKTVKSVSFPENSEVESFGGCLFSESSIEKIQIPASFKEFDNSTFYSTNIPIEFDISPQNTMFSYIESNYLVGKSQENSPTFDILYFARYDIEDALIPPGIKILKNYSFLHHYKLNSIIFPENSELECIDSYAIRESSLKKLVLPASIESEFIFIYTPKLVHIEVSPNNKIYKSIDNKFLCMKSSPESPVFDVFVFAARDTESITIPSYIKRIENSAFLECYQLKSVTFEPNSSLEQIGFSAFRRVKGLKTIVFPPSVKTVSYDAFEDNEDLESIEFLGESVTLYYCISDCDNFSYFLFTNAKKISFEYSFLTPTLSKKFQLKVRKDAELVGNFFELIQDKIIYIESEPTLTNSESEPTLTNDDKPKEAETKPDIDESQKPKEENTNDDSLESNDKSSDQTNQKKIMMLEDENKILMSHIRFLENQLIQYQNVTRFSKDSIQKSEIIDYEVDKNNEKKFEQQNQKEENNLFFDNEDEMHHQIISKIGEGASSIAYKIIDDRTSQVMCKKVLKNNEGSNDLKNVQNILKEFEVLAKIDHPCICRAIKINTQANSTSSEENKLEEGIYFNTDQNQNESTTVSILLEYLPYSLKSLLGSNFLNNTLKVKIVVEVAFGMPHIHREGMIHRDLKIENIMLNYILEAKIIDFGLVHVNDLDNSLSLTKGVGTLAYMSPEMQNEEDYNAKTDVYSFGVVLFAMFTGRLPKQSMKDKLTNMPQTFPPASQYITKYCIELIKKCMCFDPVKRPTFDEILDDMKDNDFQLANEVDKETILRRYRALNRFKVQQEQLQK